MEEAARETNAVEAGLAVAVMAVFRRNHLAIDPLIIAVVI
jgi:hypothetical protein